MPKKKVKNNFNTTNNNNKNQIDEDDEEKPIDFSKLEIFDEKQILAEPTIKKIFLLFRKKFSKEDLDLNDKMRSFLGKTDLKKEITYEEFKNFYLKMITIH